MADLFTLYGTIAINATVANQTIDGTMDKVSQLTGTLQVAGEQAEKSVGKNSKFGSASVWMGNMFTKMTTGAVDLGKKLYGIGIGYNAGVQTASTHLTTLLKGDTEAANDLIKKLEQLAVKTPLGTAGLVANAKELLGYGIKLEDVVPTLEMLGNFALGDQTKLDGIVRAYGQIFANGMLFGQDANQLVNQDVPIFQLLSEHAGGRYEGMTRGDMIGDKTNPVLFEDVHAAMAAATSEGGKFFNAMFNTMDTYQGQLDKLGETGEQSMGKLFGPLFETMSSDVLPKLSESLTTFNTWIGENQESITKFSEAIGQFVTSGFDMMLNAFKWITENGEAVGTALGVIAVGIAAGAIAAHPYAAAILAIAAALAALQTGGTRTKEKLFTYSDEDLSTLQRYVDAVNAAKEAEAAYFADDWSMADPAKNKAWLDTKENLKNAEAEVKAIDGLMKAYENWLGTQGAEGAFLDVPIRPAEESEGEIQSSLDGYSLEGLAEVYAAANSETLIQNALNAMDLSATVKLKPDASALGDYDGSHAGGLDRVPFNGYRALLHKDEMVLTASQAAVYRREKGVFDGTGRTRKASASAEPVTVNLTVNGVSSNPYEIASEVRNALEIMRWQG